ncbi:hypothetical protein [Acidihalobacter ferrooxydans]|uniref:hypothetical protein n=1 Tax=Acidihalobacter ferrooxydans TaxID=1765967 RepID=UPI0009FAE49F|nr:hypothetical protein [Acidihalobacter ferrooxydans]
MPGIDADIQQLWDELADFDAAHSDQTMHHLLNFLNEDLHAINVLWFVAIHLHSLKPDDPVFGWRPRVHGYLYPDAALEKRSRDAKQSIECGKINPSMIRSAALAGQWRANRLVDLVEPEWFESEFYRDYHLAHNHGDAIWLACPINEDSEVYFGIFRSNDAPRFSPEDRDRPLRIVCGL